jgi:hypothetical protein
MVLACLPHAAGASEDQKTFVFRIIHRHTPASVCRVDTADGRSPGSRIGASSSLPGGKRAASGPFGRDYPLTVAGAAAD